jgi:hypothetical protein
MNCGEISHQAIEKLLRLSFSPRCEGRHEVVQRRVQFVFFFQILA